MLIVALLGEQVKRIAESNSEIKMFLKLSNQNQLKLLYFLFVYTVCSFLVSFFFFF